jgi:hypothetical protein
MSTAPSENEGQSSESEPRREGSKSRAGAAPTFAAVESQAQDLAGEISITVPRRAGEVVRCRHIFGDRYRCNWWAPQDTDEYDNPSMAGLMVTTHRVVRSQLVRATKTAKGLEINPVLTK